MSNIFADQVYEEMDWLSKATEPMIDPRNELLSKLPDSIEITLDDIKKALRETRYDSFRMSVNDILNSIIEDRKLDIPQFIDIRRCFKSLVSDNCSLTIKNNELVLDGTIKVIKEKTNYSEKESCKYMANMARNIMNTKKDYLDKDRINELSGLFNAEAIGKLRSVNKKYEVLLGECYRVLVKNEWNIKSVDLGIKVGIWINAYIKDGDVSAIANLWKIKAMTHSNLPIYSINEA